MNMHVRMGSAWSRNHLIALALADISSPAALSPKRERYELTQADAQALTDAGLMPVSHYIELAERHGWNIKDH
jgi:hypothetical protein